MGEVSEKLTKLSDARILGLFREALVQLCPLMSELDILDDDSQPYDDFDIIVDALYDVMVSTSFRWKYGLDSKPLLPKYGMFRLVHSGPFIRVTSTHLDEPGRFVQFIGNRAFGSDYFNAIDIETPQGLQHNIGFAEDVAFEYVDDRGS